MTILSACASATGPIAARGPEQVFPSPQQAAEALVAANRADDRAALIRVLGPGGENLISSGDARADRLSRDKFVAAYDTAHAIERGEGDRDVLIVGNEAWPLPIPIIRVEGGWQFDTAAGEQEILNRRIGHNELTVIQICREYVRAQREYAMQHPLGHRRAEYAQKFVSDDHKHNGLYWQVGQGERESPLGPLIAQAEAQGYPVEADHARHEHRPFFGYYYKILKAQGPNAAGGAMDYVVKGHMTRGFALLAYPAKYGDSGVMTFMVDANGIVYEKNLGPETMAIASQLTRFDPDKGWEMARD